MKHKTIIHVPAALGLLALVCSPAFGGGHTWRVNEAFSNADGSIQFIELKEVLGGATEIATANHALTSNTRSFTVTQNVVAPTSFRHILIATSSFAALPGAPTPDYILPAANFFTVSADTLTFQPWGDPLAWTSNFPTDGMRSLNRGIGVANMSPTNYAGQTFAVPPPGVPDGSTGTAMTVVALDPAGNDLRVTFDTATCGGTAAHHIIYGEGSDLPIAAGGSFGLLGAVCSVPGSPYNWIGSPTAADGSGLIWWLVVRRNTANAEGPWGKDSSGVERVGPGAGGSSGLCGVTTKSVSSVCGH